MLTKRKNKPSAKTCITKEIVFFFESPQTIVQRKLPRTCLHVRMCYVSAGNGKRKSTLPRLLKTLHAQFLVSWTCILPYTKPLSYILMAFMFCSVQYSYILLIDKISLAWLIAQKHRHLEINPIYYSYSSCRFINLYKEVGDLRY